MDLIKKIRTFVTILLSWACCCCFMCTPDDGRCYNQMAAYPPYGVDSLQVKVVCGNSTINDWDVFIFSDDLIWGESDTLDCKMTMDVLCKNVWYPYTDYEWTFYRNNEKLHILYSRDSEGTQLPVKNSVCGVQKRYAVVVKESCSN